jgi:hypothetical protein
MDIIHGTHVHVLQHMSMYMQYMYMVHTAHTGFNQLSLQVLVDNTDLFCKGVYGWGQSLSRRDGDSNFLMQGQTQLKQRRPSASLSVAWSVRSYLVLRACIHR